MEFGSAENETASNFQDSLEVGVDNFTYNKLPIPIAHCLSGPFRSSVVLVSGTGLVLARSLVCATRLAHAHLATARARARGHPSAAVWDRVATGTMWSDSTSGGPAGTEAIIRHRTLCLGVGPV